MATNGVFVNPLQQTVSRPSNSNGRSHTAAQQRPLAYVRPDSSQPTGLVPHSSMERNRIQKKLDFINTPSAQPESHTENFLEFLRQPSSSVRFLTVEKMTNRLLSSYEFKPPQALCRPTRYPASIFSHTEWAIHLGLIARPPDINTLPRTSDSNILPRTSDSNILPRTSDSNILPRTSDSNILHRTSDSNILHRTSDSNILPRTSDSNILSRTSDSNILPRTSASNIIPRPPVSCRLARPEDRDPFDP
ncbi:uncharacterized protein LOC129926005 [Biomphalaria glabrata]|uniref:Uncharacterized protein LOC129926005 n=1 Tax=Biomphalaria glabrata TaxID=6526 RepID=A0A9W3A8Y9_BIOGL|nr:uncharacterized protein LOC129926005 [Biomphalaria glabrata]